MTDWREIPARNVDFTYIPKRDFSGKQRVVVARLFANDWGEKTLGEIADLGVREWRQMPFVGPKIVEAIKWIIDEAAEGRCPMKPESGAPAYDAYVPKSERESQ